MTNLSMFLQADQDRAKKELDCFDYLMMNAIEHIAKGDFGKAAVFHENIARSLHELQALKNSKIMDDQIKEHQQLNKMPVNIYE